MGTFRGRRGTDGEAMTPDALRHAIASGDEQAARRAVRACGDSLREGSADEPSALIAALVALATHPSPIIRQAVADVCDAFPDREFDETHARLLSDVDHYVVAAAEAAGHRHAQGRLRRTKRKAEEKLVVDALHDLERTYDKGARRLAEGAVERGIEHFTAHLAHEVMKAELSNHRALSELEAELERPERRPLLVKEQIATVRVRSKFAFSMIRRARDYTERSKRDFKEESLAPLLEEARAQLVDRLGPKSAKLALSLDVDPAIRLEMDRHLVLQALQNVLQNAAEAYPEGAARLAVRVSASARRGGSEVVIVVADDGAGIPEEHLETLFVPFGSRKTGGTGLGLLIVRRAIEEVHGGELVIASPPGEGTSVTMTLPAKQGRR